MPRWIRLWHLVHAVLFLPLFVTGWHLHYGALELWGYARSVRLHEALGLAAAGLVALHLAALGATRRCADYLPPRRDLGRAVAAELRRYTVGIWRSERPTAGGPDGARLNPVQRLLYAPLLFLVLPGLALTGLSLLGPSAGLELASRPWPRALVATAHAALALAASLFLLVHLYMASMAERGRMRLRPLRRAVPLGLLLAALPVLAAAEEVAGSERRLPALPCFGCHSGTSTSRREVVDPRSGTRKDVTVELDRKAMGVHGSLACATCHSRGFDRFPHRPAAERRFPACRDCHPRREPPEAAARDAVHDFPRLEREHAGTAHATAFRKERGARDCEGCHHPHYMLASAALAAPARLRADHDAPCRLCHEAGAAGPLADPLRPDLAAAHAAVPYAERHLASVRCVDCHASRGRPAAHDLLSGEAAFGCVDCHRADSALLAGLWRFVPEARATRAGFPAAPLLDEHRVMGLHRPVLLDRLALGGIGILGLAIAAHAGLRLLARLRRSVRDGRA